MKIKAMAWPWQDGYDWLGQPGCTAPMNQIDKRGGGTFGARFGAGWNWKLGISFGSTCAMIDLLFGSLWITYRIKKD